MLEVGVKAPDFTLKDKDGKEVALSSFRGKKVVLYFYPKDNTPGCTRQACAFAGAYAGFKERNVEVIGVSRDSGKSHAGFAAKYGLPFILLSDPELTAIQAYDVWKEKKLYGKVSMGVVRSTYVIDEDGVKRQSQIQMPRKSWIIWTGQHGKLRISLKIAFRQLCLKQPFGGHYLQGLLFLYPESPCYVHMCANIRLISNGWDFRMIWKCMRVYKNFIWGW